MQQYLLQRSDDQMAQTLDQKKYNNNQLVELRVPLNMPYYQNTAFQRHDGHITIKGVDYNYVERKIENGFLVLKCIQNEASGKIKQNTGDYFAKANGIDKSGHQKSGSSKTTVKTAIDDFEEVLLHSTSASAYKCVLSTYPEYLSLYIPVQHQESPERPPEIVA